MHKATLWQLLWFHITSIWEEAGRVTLLFHFQTVEFCPWLIVECISALL